MRCLAGLSARWLLTTRIRLFMFLYTDAMTKELPKMATSIKVDKMDDLRGFSVVYNNS